LLLVRVQNLDTLNRRVGRALADRVLRAVAESLARQESCVAGSFSGRLNGSDFALYWPGPNSTEQASRALVGNLESQLPSLAASASACIGSTELEGLPDLGSALVAVDDALAQAETLGAFGWSHRGNASLNATLRREDEWRERIELALAEGSAELVEFPVVDAAGGLMHLECPLRLRFDSNGVPVPAALWLAHAARSGLTPQLDLRAVHLALAAIDSDGRARGVHIGLDSLTSVGFIGALQRSLEARSRICPLLLLELPERAWVEHPQLLRDAASQWHATGVAVGLEHAGGASAHLGRLYDLGLEFVKVDRRHLDGVAGSDHVRHFAASMVALLHGMRIKVIAEGVRSQDDLAALWQLGFDGATGPAVRL
jgi:EAL domain-containing protein (putative c-di-GMP-specific phosphodiesterase class I)/GGDEF domain-containing protein